MLVIGPYQGLHACLRIPFTRGVCGAVARTRETQVRGWECAIVALSLDVSAAVGSPLATLARRLWRMFMHSQVTSRVPHCEHLSPFITMLAL